MFNALIRLFKGRRYGIEDTHRAIPSVLTAIDNNGAVLGTKTEYVYFPRFYNIYVQKTGIVDHVTWTVDEREQKVTVDLDSNSVMSGGDIQISVSSLNLFTKAD